MKELIAASVTSILFAIGLFAWDYYEGGEMQRMVISKDGMLIRMCTAKDIKNMPPQGDPCAMSIKPEIKAPHK